MFVSKDSLLRCCSFLACVVLSRAQICPPQQQITPCTCKTVPNNPAITTCNRIRNMRTLEQVFRESQDFPLFRLEVVRSHFSYFPAAALLSKGIQHLEITGSVMMGLFERIPEENHKLEKLIIYSTKLLKRVDWKLFKNFRKLTHLQISGSRIGRMSQEFRDNVPSTIDYLMLGDSRVGWLQDRVFDQLKRATHLQVSGGRIRTLKRSMFPKENRIRSLGFNDNRLSHLPDDIFNDMPKLQVLYLDGNRFTTLSEKVFGQVYERSVMLTFTRNKFLCDCGIWWIVKSEKKGRLDAKCDSPTVLKGKSIQQIPLKDLEYCKHV